MDTKISDSGTNRAQTTQADNTGQTDNTAQADHTEDMDTFLSNLDMNNISVDDAKRFANEDMIKKYHELSSARLEANNNPASGDKSNAGSNGQQPADIMSLIQKAMEKSGSDCGLSEVIDKVGFIKNNPVT